MVDQKKLGENRLSRIAADKSASHSSLGKGIGVVKYAKSCYHSLTLRTMRSYALVSMEKVVETGISERTAALFSVGIERC